MYCFILLLLVSLADAYYHITVFGDVLKDKEFFTKTYPWIIDNIGGHVTAKYYLLGSGRYSVPQMCALSQLRGNTFLQAQYLKCEAEGSTRPEKCLCSSGIDAKQFRRCVLEGGSEAGYAAARHSALGIDASPIIEMWRSPVFGLTDSGYLKEICTMFYDNDRPRSCEKPVGCDSSTAFVERRAIAQFTCSWRDEDDDDVVVTTTTTTTTPTPTPPALTGFGPNPTVNTDI